MDHQIEGIRFNMSVSFVRLVSGYIKKLGRILGLVTCEENTSSFAGKQFFLALFSFDIIFGKRFPLAFNRCQCKPISSINHFSFINEKFCFRLKK